MILVEDGFGPLKVEVVLGLDVPGHLAEPLEVVADDAGLRRSLRNPLKPTEFALGLLADGFGHPGRVDPLAQLLQLRRARITLPQLLLNRLELLVQEVLALRLVDLTAHVGLDLLGQLQHLQLVLQGGVDLAEPLGHVEGLQQLLLLHQPQ